MKCSNCSALCLDADQVCLACGHPIRGAVPAGDESWRPHPYAALLAVVIGLGAARLNLWVAEELIPDRAGAHLDVARLVFAVGGGVIGGLVAYCIVRARTRREPVRRPAFIVRSGRIDG